MSKINLAEVAYTSKNDYIQQAILGGHSIEDANKFWDENLKGARGDSFFGAFMEELKKGGFKDDAEVIAYIKKHVDKTGKKTMSSKGFYTSINEVVNQIRKDLTK